MTTNYTYIEVVLSGPDCLDPFELAEIMQLCLGWWSHFMSKELAPRLGVSNRQGHNQDNRQGNCPRGEE